MSNFHTLFSADLVTGPKEFALKFVTDMVNTGREKKPSGLMSQGSLSMINLYLLSLQLHGEFQLSF